MDKEMSRSKFVAVFVAIALALSMVGITSASAFADSSEEVTGGFKLSSSAITVTAGESVDLSQYVIDDSIWTDPEGIEYHFDYVINETETDTTVTAEATVNKHSGVFIGTTAGEATVDVYLLEGSAPSGNSGRPCTGYTVLAEHSITVTVEESSATYGFQGGANAIMMISPVVKTVSGSFEEGYTNNLGTIEAAEDGYYYFTYQTSAGFRNYSTPLAYAEYNAKNITLTNTRGTTTFADLEAANTGGLTISAVDTSAQTVTVKVDSSVMNSSSATLTFLPGLKANNELNTLETTVSFNFEII